jgi:protein tyrosine phosphatase
MMENLINWLITSEVKEKVVIHCSAGIGRTGTTIALCHLILNLWTQRNQNIEPKISVFSTVRRIREQRYGLV